MINTVQTMNLLSLDKIDNVKKLATDPISIVIASTTDIQIGFPRKNISTMWNVEMIDDNIGTAIKHPIIAVFNVKSLFILILLSFKVFCHIVIIQFF